MLLPMTWLTTRFSTNAGGCCTNESATGLELVYRDNLNDHLAALTHHYARSGNPKKQSNIVCLRSSKARERGSFAEAVALFETGLDLLRKLPDDDSRADRELDLRNAAYSALGDTKGLASPEVERSTERAIALCQRPGVNWGKSWWALFSLFFVQQTASRRSQSGSDRFRIDGTR